MARHPCGPGRDLGSLTNACTNLLTPLGRGSTECTGWLRLLLPFQVLVQLRYHYYFLEQSFLLHLHDLLPSDDDMFILWVLVSCFLDVGDLLVDSDFGVYSQFDTTDCRMFPIYIICKLVFAVAVTYPVNFTTGFTIWRNRVTVSFFELVYAYLVYVVCLRLHYLPEMQVSIYPFVRLINTFAAFLISWQYLFSNWRKSGNWFLQLNVRLNVRRYAKRYPFVYEGWLQPRCNSVKCVDRHCCRQSCEYLAVQ